MNLKKRIGLLALIVAVVGMLFLNAWQGYRYHALSRQVAELEAAQKDLLERNRDAIAEIAHEESPGRVAEKAGNTVAPLDPAQLTRVTVEKAGGGQ